MAEKRSGRCWAWDWAARQMGRWADSSANHSSHFSSAHPPIRPSALMVPPPALASRAHREDPAAPAPARPTAAAGARRRAPAAAVGRAGAGAAGSSRCAREANAGGGTMRADGRMGGWADEKWLLWLALLSAHLPICLAEIGRAHV